MAHRTAKLTAYGRQSLVDRIAVEQIAIAHAASMAGVSRTTAHKWLRRFREAGAAGLEDRPSRPRHSPRALAASQVAAVLAARDELGCGPHRLARIVLQPALDERRRARSAWPLPSRRS